MPVRGLFQVRIHGVGRATLNVGGAIPWIRDLRLNEREKMGDQGSQLVKHLFHKAQNTSKIQKQGERANPQWVKNRLQLLTKN